MRVDPRTGHPTGWSSDLSGVDARVSEFDFHGSLPTGRGAQGARRCAPTPFARNCILATVLSLAPIPVKIILILIRLL